MAYHALSKNIENDFSSYRFSDFEFIILYEGVAGGEWQTIVWVAPHDTPPPEPPLLAPWPERQERIITTAIANPDSPNLARTVSEMEVLTAIDPDRFAAHEKFLKKMPFAQRFFSDVDPEIDFTAALGKIEEIRDFLSQGKFWGPSAEQAAAIEKALLSIPKEEKVIKSWVVLAINANDFEHERVLVVTDRAHYRVKYDPKKGEVVTSKRFPVKNVYQVFAGRFKDAVPSVLTKIRAPVYEKQYGVQIWAENPKEFVPPKMYNPFQKTKVPFNLYRPLGTSAAELTMEFQESVCSEICLAFQASVHWYRNGSRPIDYIHEFAAESPKLNDDFPAFPARKVEFIDRCVAQTNGLMAYAHNKIVIKK